MMADIETKESSPDVNLVLGELTAIQYASLPNAEVSLMLMWTSFFFHLHSCKVLQGRCSAMSFETMLSRPITSTSSVCCILILMFTQRAISEANIQAKSSVYVALGLVYWPSIFTWVWSRAQGKFRRGISMLHPNNLNSFWCMEPKLQLASQVSSAIWASKK